MSSIARVVTAWVAGAAVALLGASASAITFTFDQAMAGNKYTDAGSGIDVTLTPSVYANDDSNGAITLTNTQNGAGVSVPRVGGDSAEFDGDGPDEEIELVFSESVVMTGFVFKLIDADFDEDEVRVILPGKTIDPLNLAVINGAFDLTFGTPIGQRTGVTFTFQTTDNNDDYRLFQVMIAPEPGTAGLLGLGLAGLALRARSVRRRR